MLTFQETLAPLHCTEKNTDAAALQTAVQLVSVSPLPMSRANAIALVQKYIKKKIIPTLAGWFVLRAIGTDVFSEILVAYLKYD